jgi:hypothetical protein
VDAAAKGEDIEKPVRSWFEVGNVTEARPKDDGVAFSRIVRDQIREPRTLEDKTVTCGVQFKAIESAGNEVGSEQVILILGT